MDICIKNVLLCVKELVKLFSFVLVESIWMCLASLAISGRLTAESI